MMDLTNQSGRMEHISLILNLKHIINMGIKIKYLKNRVIEGQPWLEGQECTVMPDLAVMLLREGSAEYMGTTGDKVETEYLENVQKEINYIKSKLNKDGIIKG